MVLTFHISASGARPIHRPRSHCRPTKVATRSVARWAIFSADVRQALRKAMTTSRLAMAAKGRQRICQSKSAVKTTNKGRANRTLSCAVKGKRSLVRSQSQPPMPAKPGPMKRSKRSQGFSLFCVAQTKTVTNSLMWRACSRHIRSVRGR